MQTKPNIPRLKHGIEILKDVIAKQRPFNLDYWFNHKRQEEPKDEWCGTTACACGYFALDKEFSDQGFQLKIEAYDSTTDEDIHKTVGSIDEFNTIAHNTSYSIYDISICVGSAWDSNGCPEYSGMAAAAEFFGIMYSEAMWFFDPGSYGLNAASPQDVIARIEKFITEHENA
jgi:hypothetical protein